jgi:hypothetical protein
MPGDLFQKERAIVTLQDRTNTTALTNNSGAAAATADLDARAAGNVAEDFLALFELFCRWGTISGILAGVAVAELYLVPLLDGTNLPDVDLTAGSSACPMSTLAGVFPCARQAVAATDMRFVSGPVLLFPALYRAYIINRSGQTITTTSGTSWQLRVVTARNQYT